jgi:hypothetical protein
VRLLALLLAVLYATSSVAQGIGGGGVSNGGVGGTPYKAVGGSTAATNASRAGHALNVIDDFGAHGNAIVQNYLVTTTASNCTVSFTQYANQYYPAPAFTSANVGMPIEIGGAGAAGGTLTTTIATVTSASQITTTLCPSTALAGVAETIVAGYDDTSEIQAAFNASVSSPAQIPCGKYRITGPLTLPFGGYVFGRSVNQYYYYPGSAQYNTPANVPPPCVMLLGDRFSSGWSGATAALTLGGYAHLEGFGLDMSFETTYPVIYGNMPFNEVIHNNTYGGQYSIETDYNANQDQGWVVDSNNFSTAAVDCIRINSITDGIVRGNWAHGCGGNAVNNVNSGSITYLGNVLENSTSFGINFYGGSGNIVAVANKIGNNYGGGVSFQQTTGTFPISLTGNEFSGNAAGVSSANIFWNGANTSPVILAGNMYAASGNATYQVRVASGGSIAAGSAAYETWPAMLTAIYYDTGSQAAAQPILQNSPNNLPGPYANDAAAAAAGVPVGAEYYDSAGIVRKRIS